MPNFKQHVVAGLAVGAAVSALTQWHEQMDHPGQRFDWGELFLCASVAGVGSALPDILEPADSPNHRGFFHSFLVAAAIAWIISSRHMSGFSTIVRRLLLGLGAGYIIHILQDALTPRSVALVGLRSLGLALIERR